MKNVLKAFGVFSMVLIIGFSFTACGGDDDGDSGGGGGGGSGGTFTLTDIPSQYDGMYARIKYVDYGVSNGLLCGYKSWNEKTDTYTFCRISNGSVKIPMRNGFGKDAKGFSGNKTNTLFRVDIFYSETGGIGGGLFFQASRASNVTFDSVTFSNGNATKSWNDGY